MNKLELLEQSIAHALGITPDVVELRVASAVITAFRSNQSDGVTAQHLADDLLPIVQPFLPASGPIGVVLQILSIGEPYVGKLIDWTEMRFAKTVAGADLQDDVPRPLP